MPYIMFGYSFHICKGLDLNTFWYLGLKHTEAISLEKIQATQTT